MEFGNLPSSNFYLPIYGVTSSCHYRERTRRLLVTMINLPGYSTTDTFVCLARTAYAAKFRS